MRSDKKYQPLTAKMVKWLNDTAKKLGLRQCDVREKTGMRQAQVSILFTGKAKFVQRAQWESIEKALTIHAEPRTQSTSTGINAEELRTTVKRLKETTKSGWETLAHTLGIHDSTLRRFLEGTPIQDSTLTLIHDKLRALNTLPDELVKEGGLVLPPFKMTGDPGQLKTPAIHAQYEATKKKVSIISAAPASPFSELELDMRELDILSRERELLVRMRQHIVVPGKHLNGARK